MCFDPHQNEISQFVGQNKKISPDQKKSSPQNHKRSRVFSSPLALFLVPILSSKGSASSRVGFFDMNKSGELSCAEKSNN